MPTPHFLKNLYGTSLALLTDLYELTMAYGYWKKGIAQKQSIFHLFFRKKPFGGSFAIAAGLDTALEYIESFHFSESDLEYLAQLKDRRGGRLFEQGFLDTLAALKLTCSIDAVPEGTVVFPYEPLLRVQGPILQAQLLEPALLNIINFQTLIATKAARICFAAHGDSVIEFGTRRAQGIDGALSASRAAFIGGCESTSNVLAGKFFDIPVSGTIAHSWVLAFSEEEKSFEAYAESMPYNCMFLLDTYDTIEGAKRAITVAKRLRERGGEFSGVRLDSGDLARLSIEVRKLLDEAGFRDARIMASNELDEFLIRDLKSQGAKIDLWGVGTHLVTGKEQPALDGVYKLAAIETESGTWEYKIKVSEAFAKTTDPGLLQVRRFLKEGIPIVDMIYDLETPLPETCHIMDPLDMHRVFSARAEDPHRDLLIPAMDKGSRLYPLLSLKKIQEHTKCELAQIPEPMRRFLNPEPPKMGMEESLYRKKQSMVQTLRRS